MRSMRSRNWFGRKWGYTLLAVVAVASLGLTAAALNLPPTQPSTTTPWTPKPQTPQVLPPKALFIGDSYTAGVGASEPELRWTTLVSTELGWTEKNEGRGGTGYVKTSGVEGCGLEHCPIYSEAIAASTTFTPDVVIISGGRNDGQATEGYNAAVQGAISTAKKKWPKATVVVTSPIWDDDAAPQWWPTLVTTVREAAAASGATFLDMGHPLQGNVRFVTEDGVHPNDAGHRAIAAEFLAAWPIEATS